MSNPWEKQPNNQQEHQTESQAELITENEFKEKTNKMIDDVLVTNIKDSDFDLKDPEDKEWYNGIIGVKNMLEDGNYNEPRFFAGPDGLRVPKSFETPEGFLKERLSRYQEDMEKNKEKPGYLTDDMEKRCAEQIKELNSLLKFIEDKKAKRDEVVPDSGSETQTEMPETNEKLEGEELFNQQIENNAHPEAKNLKEETTLFLDSLDRHDNKTELNSYREEIGEILYRRGIEYDPNKKPEFPEKDRAILEPLWKFRKELDEWNTFTEPRVSDYRKRIFGYLHSAFGIEENKPNDGEKLNSKEHRTVKVEETNNQFLDNLIKKVIKPGFKINNQLYEYYKNNFLAEDKKKQEEFRKIKDQVPQEEFDKRYDAYLKWKKQHEFTKAVRSADVIINKYKPENK